LLCALAAWLFVVPHTQILPSTPAVATSPTQGPMPVTAPMQQKTSTVLPLSSERESTLMPRDVFQECSMCPRMIVVPAGTFTMGSPNTEVGRDKDEGPQHKVTFAKPFAVSVFALTFDEWDACVADGGCDSYRPPDQGWGRGRQPVINVSWDDAKAYVAWLSRTTGKRYHLLSEAEREYVTRAGTTTPFWWGDSISTNQANYNGNYTYGTGVRGVYRARTVVVDFFDPNSWGLFQVHGNVGEWVEDCFHNYVDAPLDGSPAISGDCVARVLRGLSWDRKPVYLRSAARLGWSPSVRDNSFGFRVARTLLDPPKPEK
jgi:formylglycine-generating enzyme required for sulfatase activity